VNETSEILRVTALPSPVVLAHTDEDTLGTLQDALSGHTDIAAVCRTRADLEAEYQSRDTGMIVTGLDFPDGNGLEVLIRLSVVQPLPAVIITDRASLGLVERAAEDTLMAYIVTPVERAALLAALVLAEERHNQIVELQREVSDLRQALQDRKVIERAKGILMARDGLTERDAFQRLRTQAQSERRRIVKVAEKLLESEGAT
jgi:response regulator NasT